MIRARPIDAWDLGWLLVIIAALAGVGCSSGCVERAQAQGYGYGYGYEASGPRGDWPMPDGAVINVIDEYTWGLAYETGDASISGTPAWAAASGTGTLGEPSGGWGTTPTLGRSTTGLNADAIGAARVDTAALFSDATDPGGFDSSANDDVILPQANEWHIRMLVNVGGSVDGGSGGLFDFTYGGGYYTRMTYTSESGSNHVLSLQSRNDGAGGTTGGVSESVLIAVDNGWTLIDLNQVNDGGSTRLDVCVNGTCTAGTTHDALLTSGHPSLTPDSGVGANRAGFALGWDFLFFGYRTNAAVSEADHDRAVSDLGL